LLEFYKAVKSGVTEISVENNPLLKKEEYTIKIDECRIMVSAFCDEGLYRNFEKSVEDFENQLAGRNADLLAL